VIGSRVHAEVCGDLPRTINGSGELKVRPGVVINPDTPLKALDSVLEEIDLVLIMSVHPGFWGQGFIPSTLGKG